ncbi:MAG: hypothetical protein FJ279_27490, partial [Planctomycetes bacterium]|nr:hypothetical protein [Planctomycetota bacterium]
MAGLLGPAAGAKFHAWRFALYAALLLSHSILSAQPIAREVAELCNYVKNGGFEEGDKLPATWARYPAKDENDNVQLRDTASAHTGQASGLIASVTPYTPGKPWMQWNQYGIAVEGGSTLIVSFWTKTAGVAPAHAGIHFYGEGRKHLGFVKIDGPKAADDWTHVRQNVPAPPDALTMGFVLYAAEKGKTWFDDAAAIGTPTTTAARATPTLDGKLTEPCWGEQNAITTFVAHTGDKLVTEKARAWLAFDDQNLYIAFRCPHPPGAKLRQQAKQHDGDTWLDDSIEVFLDPLHNHRDYVQLCVNSLGVIRDSRAKDTAWQSSARAAVQREDAAWTIELAIPYEPLGLGLDAGTTWGINLVWNNRVRGEVATWSLGGFHAPGRFGNVSLSPDLSRFFRADLAKRLDEKEREREAMRKELDAAELPARCLDEPLRRLGQATAAIEALRRIADAAAPLPEGRWVAVRGKLADVSTMAADARRSAMNELFKVGQTGEKGDFRVAIAHSLQKIRRTGPLTDAPLIRRVRLDAARDEAESFQLVVLPNGQALKNVKVEAKPLAGPGGSVPLVWHRVGYVETAPPAYPTEYVGWWPDPLLPAGPFDVAADERQPLWFTAVVPPDAK